MKKVALLLLCCASAVSTLTAEIIADLADSTVELNYIYTAGSGGIVLEGGDSVTEPEIASIPFDLALEEENETTSFTGYLTGELSGSAGVIVNADPITGEQYFAKLGVALSSEASIGGNGSVAFYSTFPGNEVTLPFEVTEAVTGSLLGLKQTDASNTDGARVRVQEKVAGVWQTRFDFFTNEQAGSVNQPLEFTPGDWRILAQISGNANNAHGLDVELEFSITFGAIPTAYPLPEEGEYTHPLIFNEYIDSPKLALVSPSIVSETPQGDGTTIVEFSANLVNSSLCPWFSVVWGVREGQPGTESAEMLLPRSGFTNVPALATVPATGTQTVRVLDTQLSALRAGILDGSLLTTEGKELVVFRYPVDRVVDEDDIATPEQLVDDTAVGFQVPGQSSAYFFIPTPDPDEPDPAGYVGEGILWVEWEPHYALPLVRQLNVSTGETKLVQNFDRDLPMWVTSASADMGSIPEPRWTSTVSGDTMTFFDIIKHGTVQHVIQSPYDETTRNATEGDLIETQELFPKPIPIHFDRIDLENAVKLSGSLNFIPGDFAVRYEIEDGAPTSVLVDMSYTVEANLELQLGGEDTDPLATAEKTLFQAPIFSVTLPGGITFTPELVVEAGATADIARQITVPLVSRYTIEVTAGMKDGYPYYEDRSTTVPIAVSDPAIFDTALGSASVFVETEVEAKFGYPGSLVATGPTVGARLAADFALTPLTDPWWQTTADLELTAGVALDFGPFLSLVDEEKVLQTYPIFDFDSGGPLFPALTTSAMTLGPEGENPGLRPLTSPNARWSRSILPEGGASPSQTWLVPLGDYYLAGYTSSFNRQMVRVGKDGTVLNLLQPDPITSYSPVDAVALDAEHVAILGNDVDELELIEMDSDLQVSVIAGHDMLETFLYEAERVVFDGERFYVLGTDAAGSPVRRKINITCLERDGTVVWSRRYDLPDNPSINTGDICLLSDGNVAFAAETTADFSEADGGNPMVNASLNGLVVKVDGETGEPIWSNMIAHYTTVGYNSIEEAPDGSITVGGYQQPGVLSDEPSMMVIHLSSEGTIKDTLLIGHAGSPKAAAYPDAEGLFVDLPHGGETLFDQIRDMEWTDAGLWVCGQMGLFNAGSSLSTGSSGFTLRLSPELHPGRYAIHGGASEDSFERILVTPDGPLCFGNSRSFHPWPDGANAETDNTPLALWLHKLPWEGRMDFHALSSGAQPAQDAPRDRGSFFVYPRVVAGSTTGSFSLNEPDLDVYGRGDALIPGSSATILVSDILTAPKAFIPAFAEAEVDEIKALEAMPESLITDQATFLAWHQMAADSDVDGDGRNAANEFGYGTDVLRNDTLPAFVLSIDPLVIGTHRNRLATDFWPPLLDSADLLEWSTVIPLSISADPLSAELDLLLYEVEEDPELDTRFFGFGLAD